MCTCVSFHQCSMKSHLGNLKDYVLSGKCKEDATMLVTFLSQIASALHYLHSNHIVHGNLRAEHVNVVAFDKVRSLLFTRLTLNQQI